MEGLIAKEKGNIFHFNYEIYKMIIMINNG